MQVVEWTSVSRGWTLLWNYCKSTRGYNYPFGGEVLSRDKAFGLSKRPSSTPNCFVVLKNDTELLRATRSEQCAASESDSDTCTSTTQRKPAASKTMKKAAAQGTARICREFAATDFKFIKVTYIEDVEKKAVFWILPNT